MISTGVINAILKVASNDSKDRIIKMVIDHIYGGMSYNEDKVNHILEMLVDESSIKVKENINIDYIKEHLNLFIYNHEKYNIKDIEIECIDNIDAVVRIKYKYLEKINEDREDISYIQAAINISYIDYPDILL